MGFKTKASSGNGGTFETPPAGTQQAVLVALVELGTHTETYKGESSDKRQILLVWELVEEKMSGSKFNFVIGHRLTQSLNEKATLRKWVETWINRKLKDDEEFDLGSLLGKSCLLVIEHTGSGDKTYAKVTGISPLHKSMKPLPSLREHFGFQLEDGEEGLKKFPHWLPYVYGSKAADLVRECHEWQGGGANGREPGQDDDDGVAPDEVAEMEERF